ncbi:MAG: hypothetical protein DLM68_10470 [Hyphomicrobiales bacterium]|nr:MAG: hypothetical protein DLM68_10470 [Hyphomicrobiales bacterium]
MFRPFNVMRSAMLLRRALIRAGFADHLLLTLSMAYVACRRREISSQIPKLPENLLRKRTPAMHCGATPNSLDVNRRGIRTPSSG